MDAVSTARDAFFFPDSRINGTVTGRLSPAEHTVLQGILSALSNKQIAAHLRVTMQTVCKHHQRILRKLRVRNDVELVLHVVTDLRDAA